MKYQLTIQWPAKSLEDYDAMIAIEDMLIDKLSNANEVDGHDVGAEQVNIFIRTNDAMNSFDEVKNILGRSECWNDAKVAYREITADTYTILWPKSATTFVIH